MRKLSIIPMAVAATVLFACGGSPPPQPGAPAGSRAASGHPQPTPPVSLNLTDQQQIENTIRDWNKDTLNGDGAGACSLMDQAGQEQLHQWLAQAHSTLPDNCVQEIDAFRQLMQTMSPQQQQTFLNPTFTSVSVTGDVAQVNYIDDLGTFNQLMKREGGSWKMSAYSNQRQTTNG